MKEDSLPPQPHPGMPPHIQHHNAFQHIRPPQASASPPMPNGLFQPRHPTPQPGMDSRPGSRNTIRRTSSNLVPIQHHPSPNPPQNGFAYVPNPPIYNPQATPNMPPHPSPQPQYQQFPTQQAPQPHPQMPHPQYINQQQPPVTRPASQPQIQRHDSLQPPPHHPPPRGSPQPPHQEFKAPEHSPPQPRHLSSKSRSIFTPIEEGGSVLAQHFFGVPDPPRSQLKKEASPEIRPPPRSVAAQPKINHAMPQPARPQSSEFPPPQRTDTSGSKSGARPKLNLQIPSEASDGESAVGDSALPSAGASANPARNTEHIVLPPPSPSASAVLSAGASGPPNPFARPPPPTSQNREAYTENRNNIETPISALPSRYMSNELLPSPSNFFSEWGDFGRNGLNSAVLPSPLTFPTPDQTRGSSFNSRDEAAGDKRKNSIEAESAEAKRIKT
jgi:transcription factor RLM1